MNKSGADSAMADQSEELRLSALCRASDELSLFEEDGAKALAEEIDRLYTAKGKVSPQLLRGTIDGIMEDLRTGRKPLYAKGEAERRFARAVIDWGITYAKTKRIVGLLSEPEKYSGANGEAKDVVDAFAGLPRRNDIRNSLERVYDDIRTYVAREISEKESADIPVEEVTMDSGYSRQRTDWMFKMAALSPGCIGSYLSYLEDFPLSEKGKGTARGISESLKRMEIAMTVPSLGCGSSDESVARDEGETMEAIAPVVERAYDEWAAGKKSYGCVRDPSVQSAYVM